MRDVKSSDGCTKVYRHLLFNRLPYREHGIEQNVLKLGVLLVLFDVCRHLQSNGIIIRVHAFFHSICYLFDFKTSSTFDWKSTRLYRNIVTRWMSCFSMCIFCPSALRVCTLQTAFVASKLSSYLSCVDVEFVAYHMVVRSLVFLCFRKRYAIIK
jgi:hypothetical protein